MKKIYLFIISIALAGSLYAQKIALHTSTGVQHFTGNNALVNTYNAAQNGDTIYFPGGSFTPPASFDKKLSIFGAGHYMDSTTATGKTFISGNVGIGENADQFYLEGVEITGSVDFINNTSVNQVTVKRCKINGNFRVNGNLSNPTTNLALIGNVFVGIVSLDNAQNVLISNNIFQYALFNTFSNQINNNIFLSRYDDYPVFYVFTGNNNQFNNNIFIPNDGLSRSDGIGNSYSNNLFVMASPNYGGSAVVVNSYVNIAQASIFVNQTGTVFNYAHNYHLKAPATYLGTDGTEVGIYGGVFPYKEGAVPSNPHIQNKNIAPTTDENGELNIQIQVEAQND